MTAPLTPCPGACNRTWRDAETRVDDRGRPVPHQITATPGAPVWCLECGTGIVEQLRELVDIVRLLEAEVGGQSGGDDTDPVSGSKGRPSPCAVVDDIDEITRRLEYWEDAGREYLAQPWRPACAPSDRIHHTVHWLTQHADEVLAAPFAEELGRDVTRLHRAGRRRTSTDTAEVRKPLPCRRCDIKSLWFVAGQRYISCSSCGRLMTLDEYEEWAIEYLEQQQTETTRRTA